MTKKLNMGGETIDPFTPALDQDIQLLMSDWHVPGMSIAITSHGHASFKGYGYSDLDSKTPVEPENLFYIASITKHVFSAALLHFIDSKENQQGPKITLQTPFAEIIHEDFVLGNLHTTATTTVEDALTHRTGLPRFDMTYGGPLDTRSGITRHLRHLALTQPPRTSFKYNNIMYMVASYALEALTQTSFTEYMQKIIFEPLAMKHTFGTLADAQKFSQGQYHLATPYAWEEGEFVPRQHLDGPVGAGAFALISNVVDWVKWLDALLQKRRPVSQLIFNELTRPRIVSTDDDPEPWDTVILYCLGLQRFSYRGVEIFSHTGGHCGFTSNMILVPSLQWATVMFCNAEGAGGDALVSLGYKLVDDLLRVPDSERFDGNRFLRERNHRFELRLREARSRIYPSIPATPLSPALPLHRYAGSYHNAAFRTFTFVAQEPVSDRGGNGAGKTFLLAQPQDRYWPMTITLEHVTGEFWFGRSLSLLRFGFKAEFRLDEMGRVNSLGMALEEGDEKFLWWFDRLEGPDGQDEGDE